MTQWSFSGSCSISLSKASRPFVGWLTRFIADVQVPISPRSQWLSNSGLLESSLNKERR